MQILKISTENWMHNIPTDCNETFIGIIFRISGNFVFRWHFDFSSFSNELNPFQTVFEELLLFVFGNFSFESIFLSFYAFFSGFRVFFFCKQHMKLHDINIFWIIFWWMNSQLICVGFWGDFWVEDGHLSTILQTVAHSWIGQRRISFKFMELTITSMSIMSWWRRYIYQYLK